MNGECRFCLQYCEVIVIPKELKVLFSVLMSDELRDVDELTELVCVDCCGKFNHFWTFRKQILTRQNEKIESINKLFFFSNNVELFGSDTAFVELYNVPDIRLIKIPLSVMTKVQLQQEIQQSVKNEPSTSKCVNRVEKLPSHDVFIGSDTEENSDEPLPPFLKDPIDETTCENNNNITENVPKKRGRPKKTEVQPSKQDAFQVVSIDEIMKTKMRLSSPAVLDHWNSKSKYAKKSLPMGVKKRIESSDNSSDEILPTKPDKKRQSIKMEINETSIKKRRSIKSIIDSDSESDYAAPKHRKKMSKPEKISTSDDSDFAPITLSRAIKPQKASKRQIPNKKNSVKQEVVDLT